jgi:serine/threonine protein kinase
VHGDLRSPNLFVASNGKIKIGDFGFCRILAPEDQQVNKTEAWRCSEISGLPARQR